MKMIVESAARDRIHMTFETRIVAQLVERHGGRVIITAVIRQQIHCALGQSRYAPKGSAAAVTIDAAHLLFGVKRRKGQRVRIRGLLDIFRFGLGVTRGAERIGVFHLDSVLRAARKT